MASNLFGTDVREIVTGVLESEPRSLLVVNPEPDVVEDVVDAAVDHGGRLPDIRVLADESTLKGVMGDFLVASSAADLVESGHLELRTGESLPGNSLLVTEESVVALVTGGDRVAGLVGDDAAFVAGATEAYDADWAAAEPFHLRTPAISRVRETLGADIGPETVADFDAVLESLETARGDGDGLDEVTVSLLVAARNEVLLYDISKWGEDVGIASKATFSRTKTRLEDIGLIDTEKVPIDVGRPRLRLKLADDRLAAGDPGDVASVAQSVLAS